MSLVLAGATAVFVVTPALSTPTLLSVVITMLMSPLVAALERRGYPRTLSISIIFAAIGVSAVLLGSFAMQAAQSEWDSFREQAPNYFHTSIRKLSDFELFFKKKYAFLANVHPTESLLQWGRETGLWFVNKGPAIMGELLTNLFLAPILIFVMLSEGPAIRKQFFQLVPNRFFEVVFLVTNEISTAISDYIRAKLFEAFLVTVMTTVGLILVKAPYAIVLGLLAGITNIIPYVGPFIGAIPGIAVIVLDPNQADIIWSVVLVYLVANIIDMALIFPLVVAKLVNLHPLVLIAAVAVGGQYYGLIGMLISVPVATAIKVIAQQIYLTVYQPAARSERLTPPIPKTPA